VPRLFRGFQQHAVLFATPRKISLHHRHQFGVGLLLFDWVEGDTLGNIPERCFIYHIPSKIFHYPFWVFIFNHLFHVHRQLVVVHAEKGIGSGRIQ